MTTLPIYELEPRILSALRAQNRLIIQASTGTGKSTQLPQILLRHKLNPNGEITILQPRRLATRMLAKRVAEELGTQLGDLVGYQIRLDTRTSEKTKIRYVTEGVLLRQMTFDPQLRGIDTLIFDEFHERHLYGDISLARALQIQKTTRPDLKIIVMSATLDAAALENYLAPVQTLTLQARNYPVTIEYLPKPLPENTPIWDAAAEQTADLVNKTPGDILIFMPGAYEINRTLNALQNHPQLRRLAHLPLHGELPPDQQDRAVARADTRKIIVSTNVAETSLTIDGVTGIIDSGLARTARYDPHRGINTLLIEKISVTSAEQRAGRAGRTAPGHCIRLWAEREHHHRPLHELPEIRRLDLAEVVLTLKAADIENIADFPWLEHPDPKALARAEQLLTDLGALAEKLESGEQKLEIKPTLAHPAPGTLPPHTPSEGGARSPSAPPNTPNTNTPSSPAGAAAPSAVTQIAKSANVGASLDDARNTPPTTAKSGAAADSDAPASSSPLSHLHSPISHPPSPISQITDLGRRMLRFPVHPRYARMFIEAGQRRCIRPVALMAALTQNRSLLLRNQPRQIENTRDELLGDEHQSDFFLLMRAWRYADRNAYRPDTLRRLGIHAQTARQVAPLYQQFLQIAAAEKLDTTEQRAHPDDICKCVLAGFSDHLARRLDTATLRCELTRNRRAHLSRDTAIQNAPLLVAAEITEIQGRDLNTLLNLNTAVKEPWLAELFPGDLTTTTAIAYDETTRRVTATRQKKFRDLTLETTPAPDDQIPPGEAAAHLARQVAAGAIQLAQWNDTTDQWIARVNTLSRYYPEYEIPPITETDKTLLIEQICYGSLGARELKDKPVMPALRDWLTAEQLAALETTLPAHLTMANKRRSRLTYHNDKPPTLSARIQELYGIEGRFTLGQGRIPVKIEVLAPNQRPLQITDDLTTFWQTVYPEIKPALSRRYPRHEWR